MERQAGSDWARVRVRTRYGHLEFNVFAGLDGRGGGIRTPDPLLPKQMRYQTALRPDVLLRLYRGTASDRDSGTGLSAS